MPKSVEGNPGGQEPVYGSDNVADWEMQPDGVFVLKETRREEQTAEAFRQTAETIRAGGLATMERNHGGSVEAKTFHNIEHPLGMEKKAEKLAKIFNLPEEKLALVKMIIAWHDTVIEYDKPDPNDLLGRITRHRGAKEGDLPSGIAGNEAKSAQDLKVEMEKAKDGQGRPVFSAQEIDIAVRAIEATYPGVDLGGDFTGAVFAEYPYFAVAKAQNPELIHVIENLKEIREGKERKIEKGPLFFQPHLEEPLEGGQKVPLEVLIVALADLGHAGMASREDFFKDGNNEFRELYYNLGKPGVMDQLVKAKGKEPQDNRDVVAEKCLDWEDGQVGFAVFQALRFEKILYLLKEQNQIDGKQEKELRGIFNHYQDNIQASLVRAQGLRERYKIQAADDPKKAFVGLARNMGYKFGKKT